MMNKKKKKLFIHSQLEKELCNEVSMCMHVKIVRDIKINSIIVHQCEERDIISLATTLRLKGWKKRKRESSKGNFQMWLSDALVLFEFFSIRLLTDVWLRNSFYKRNLFLLSLKRKWLKWNDMKFNFKINKIGLKFLLILIFHSFSFSFFYRFLFHLSIPNILLLKAFWSFRRVSRKFCPAFCPLAALGFVSIEWVFIMKLSIDVKVWGWKSKWGFS